MSNGSSPETEVVGRVSMRPELRMSSGIDGSMYPIRAGYLVSEVQKAEGRELSQVIREVLAVKEGLTFGIVYDLNDPSQVRFLREMFLTVAGAVRREPLPYVDAETNDRLEQLARIAGIEGKGVYINLKNHWQARTVVDAAFSDRMRVCESDKAMAELLDPKYIKPDSDHWAAFLEGDFGHDVERAFRRIVAAGMKEEELRRLRDSLPSRIRERMEQKGRSEEEIDARIKEVLEDLQPPPGVSPDIYAKGFENDEKFAKWLRHIAEGVEGRMDAVWAAWRLALLWEVISALGKDIGPDGEITLANPPLMGDLMIRVIHLDFKRRLEWGWKADGRRIRETKYLTAGSPLTIGEITGPLVSHYLAEARINREGRQTTLWKLWLKEGYSLSELPWEMTAGSFSYWRVKLNKAFSVANDICSFYSLRDLSNPLFFGSRTKPWDDVFGKYEDYESQNGRPMPPEKNPRAWWLLGQLAFYSPSSQERMPIGRSFPEDEDLPRNYCERFLTCNKGEEQGGGVSVWTILNAALQVGFLREADVKWIIQQLSLPRPIGKGAGPF